MLWDVDGTLLRGGGVAADVFALAVEHAVGRHPGDHGVRMAGGTDPQIAKAILDLMGEPHHHLPAVIERLEHELAAAAEALRERGHVLPGVPDVLARLHDDPGVLQSVLTGNTAANAATKLAAFDLDGWIDVEVGAYCSDDHDRTALVPVAVERAARLRGRRFAPHEVWVVGDTEHDLACARAAGARCLLVGTGFTPVNGATAAAADAYLADLADVDAVVDLLRS
ncbi:MAG TPA: haloacid dehalogenase-like hydrolase [Acidimicrobiales bacterium]|nr:haloacid dehalogenase-like hydrolase [Acidimicrobiales bacterium]